MTVVLVVLVLVVEVVLVVVVVVLNVISSSAFNMILPRTCVNHGNNSMNIGQCTVLKNLSKLETPFSVLSSKVTLSKPPRETFRTLVSPDPSATVGLSTRALCTTEKAI